MSEKIRQPCCSDWATAHESGTDHDAFGPFLHYVFETDVAPSGGMDLPDFRFCPWCGQPKKQNERNHG